MSDTTTEKTCSRCDQPYDTEKILCPDCMRRWGNRRPSIGLLSCTCNHSTVEEQTVLNAVTEADFIRFLRGDVLDGYKEGAAALEAIDALLAARKEAE